MTVLITGCAGFIGSHLADKLLDEGNEVVGIDDLSTGTIDNLKHLNGNMKFSMVIESVCDKETVEGIVKGVDAVYHLAAPVGVKYIMDNPVKALLDNARGIDVVLAACNKFSKKVLVASTSEVYGMNLEYPQMRDQRTLHEDSYRIMGCTKTHRWAYAVSKAYDEMLAFAYHKEFGLPAIVVRFFNTIGPRQTGQYGMVVPSFVRAALANRPLEVYGSGGQTRCFMNIKDSIEAITKLMETPAAIGDVFNIGGSEEISMHALAELIVDLCLSESDLTTKEYHEAYGSGFEDMMHRTPNISHLQKTIDFKPKYNLEATLKEIIEYERIRSTRHAG